MTRAVQTALAGAGGVLQVVQAIPSPFAASLPNTAYGATLTTGNTISCFSATITPIATTSKILVVLVCPNDSNSTAYEEMVCLFRGSTFLACNTLYRRVSGTENINHAITYLDSPATASAITYDIRAAANTGGIALRFNQYNDGSTPPSVLYGVSLTLMEIAG